MVVQILAILGSLGSLGIFGAALTYVFTSWTKNRQDKREKVGLARILYHEMESNSIALCHQVFQSSEEMLAEKLRSGKYYLHLGTDGWEATRVRLAQLLSKKEFAVVCDYYMALRVLKDNIQEYRGQSDKTDLNEALEHAKYARSKGKTTINKCQETRFILKRYMDINSAVETPGTDPSATSAEN